MKKIALIFLLLSCNSFASPTGGSPAMNDNLWIRACSFIGTDTISSFACQRNAQNYINSGKTSLEAAIRVCSEGNLAKETQCENQALGIFENSIARACEYNQVSNIEACVSNVRSFAQQQKMIITELGMSVLIECSKNTTKEEIQNCQSAIIAKNVSCKALDRARPIPIDTKCISTKGAVFVRVSKDNFGEAWKGPDGIIWSDRIGRGNHGNALKKCADVGGALPSRSDFELGDANGILEVLPTMIPQKGADLYYWTSTITSSDSSWAYYYATWNYGHGDVGGGIYSIDRINEFSIRCILNH